MKTPTVYYSIDLCSFYTDSGRPVNKVKDVEIEAFSNACGDSEAHIDAMFNQFSTKSKAVQARQEIWDILNKTIPIEK